MTTPFRSETVQSTDPVPQPFASVQSEPMPSKLLGQMYPFKFHGQAGEYFGIWIVNLLLTIASLGLYAPWAKVRRLRYFYTNTEFVFRHFDFTGLPTKILMGRIIALSIAAFFVLAGYMEWGIAAFGGLISYLAFPWLMTTTLKFNSRNSKFANSRFYFSGSSFQAYKQYFLGLLLVIFTLGLFAPVLIFFYKRFMIDHLYAGQLKFKLNNGWSDYLLAVYVPLIFYMSSMIVVAFLIGLIKAILQSSFNDAYALGYYIGLIGFLGVILVLPFIKARIFICTWNHVSLGNSQFKTSCHTGRYAWILISNGLAKMLTVGLATPWAAIRIYKYQIESLSLHLEDDPDQMMNIAQQDHNAIAEELGDLFDFDISL